MQLTNVPRAAALALAILTARALPNPAVSVLLTDYVGATGARCLDGSPQRFWLRRNASSSKFVLHLMGGAWCESAALCAARAYAYECYLGSSRPECFTRAPGDEIPGVPYADTMDFAEIPGVLGARWGGGLLVNDPARNPLTAGWNAVEASYCSGDGWVGDQAAPTVVTFNGTANLPLYFRGGRNFAAVVDSLIKTAGLGDADEVVLTGSSAGGLAVYSHCGALAALLPRTRVLCVPDSGYFFAADKGWPGAVHWIASNGNATAFLNQACVAARARAGADPLACMLPEVASPFIAQPLFIMNSRFDPSLDIISGGEEGRNATNVNRLGAALLALVNATVLSPPNARAATNAAFLTSCHQHCGQWATNQSGPFADFNVVIDGTTAITALAQWRASLLPGADALARRLWVQQASFPCATCCSGGQA